MLEPEMVRFASAARGLLASLGRAVSFVCFTPSDASRLEGIAEPGGIYRQPEGAPRLPLMYSLRARRVTT